MIVLSRNIKRLLEELKKNSGESYFHCLRTKAYANSLMVVTNQFGYTKFTPEDIDIICKGAILHDIGKLFLQNAVLTKEGSLTENERAEMNVHTVRGFDAIKDDLSPEEYDIIKNICLLHHKRINETPEPLPDYVQIVSICDVFDALTTDRVYKEAIPYPEAMQMIKDGKCGDFDSKLVNYLEISTKEQYI